MKFLIMKSSLLLILKGNMIVLNQCQLCTYHLILKIKNKVKNNIPNNTSIIIPLDFSFIGTYVDHFDIRHVKRVANQVRNTDLDIEFCRGIAW